MIRIVFEPYQYNKIILSILTLDESVDTIQQHQHGGTEPSRPHASAVLVSDFHSVHAITISSQEVRVSALQTLSNTE